MMLQWSENAGLSPGSAVINVLGKDGHWAGEEGRGRRPGVPADSLQAAFQAKRPNTTTTLVMFGPIVKFFTISYRAVCEQCL